MGKWNWDCGETITWGQFSLDFCARVIWAQLTFLSLTPFAFWHPGLAVLGPTAEGMLWCLLKHGLGQGAAHWQCRAGWMLTPGNQMSSVPAVHVPLLCWSVLSLMCSRSLLKVIFFQPFSTCQAGDDAADPNPRQPLNDTKAQEKLFHFWWGFAPLAISW